MQTVFRDRLSKSRNWPRGYLEPADRIPRFRGGVGPAGRLPHESIRLQHVDADQEVRGLVRNVLHTGPDFFDLAQDRKDYGLAQL